MLRRGGEGVPESGRTRLQELLVVGQVTVSLMLLVCTGLFVRTLQNLRSVDPGFSSRHVVNLRMDLSLRNLPESAGLAFYDQLLDQVERLPGVEAAALTLTVPLARVAGETRIGSLRPLRRRAAAADDDGVRRRQPGVLRHPGDRARPRPGLLGRRPHGGARRS